MARSSPPKFFLRFFRWYCHPRMLDYIEGDLMEVHRVRLRKFGKRNADLKFIIDVLLLFRPGIIKPVAYHSNLNHYTMFKNYFKIGVRNHLRHKGYFVINVLGLTLGLSCAIIIFSLIKYHLSFNDFHDNPERIYRFTTEKHRETVSFDPSTPPPLAKVFRDEYSFGEKVSRLCTFDNVLITITERGENSKFTEKEGIAFAEEGFFDIFNFPVLKGSGESALAAPGKAIMTERAAKKYFGDDDPIGKIFLLENKITFEVVGVLKDIPANSDIQAQIFVSYVTLKDYRDWMAADDSWGGMSDAMQSFIRLRPGVTPGQVEEVLPAYVKKYRPTSTNKHVYKLQPLGDIHFDTRFNGVIEKQTLWILSTIGLFLVLTACVNFVNLAAAQAIARSKEVGVRKVLGGLKGHISMQFMTETALITGFAVLCAVGVAMLVMPSVNELFFNTNITVTPFSDRKLLLFIGLLFASVTLLAGIYPALVLSGFKPVIALKGKLAQRTVGGLNMRRTLIVTQFVIAQVLIIGMIVIVVQMRYAKESDLGFDKNALLMIPTGSQDQKTNTIRDQIRQLPGVERISVCAVAPLSSAGWNTGVKVGSNEQDEIFRIMDKAGDEHYIETFGLELVAGRNLLPADSVREFVVNETLARKLNLKSSQELLGLQLTIAGNLKGPIVGVVKDFYNHTFHEQIEPVFISTNPDRRFSYGIKLKSSQIIETMASIEKLWSEAYPEQIYEYRFLDDQIAEYYIQEEIMLKLVQAFSFISIFISCLGLYGLMSFMAIQKTKEIGIRKVLGSTVPQVMWIFGREFSLLIIIAFAIASPIAWYAMSQWLQGFQYHIDLSIYIFVAAILITAMISLLTVSYQAVKAALVNPVKSLRSE